MKTKKLRKVSKNMLQGFDGLENFSFRGNSEDNQWIHPPRIDNCVSLKRVALCYEDYINGDKLEPNYFDLINYFERPGRGTAYSRAAFSFQFNHRDNEIEYNLDQVYSRMIRKLRRCYRFSKCLIHSTDATFNQDALFCFNNPEFNSNYDEGLAESEEYFQIIRIGPTHPRFNEFMQLVK